MESYVVLMVYIRQCCYGVTLQPLVATVLKICIRCVLLRNSKQAVVLMQPIERLDEVVFCMHYRLYTIVLLRWMEIMTSVVKLSIT